MHSVNIESLPILDVKSVINIVGNYYTDDLEKEFKESGVYRILSGSRGILEEIEKVASLDAKTIDIPTREEVVKILFDGDESELEELTEYVEEYYGYEIEDKFMTFGYTEEEFDYYFRVSV